jgi:hypothetical protein
MNSTIEGNFTTGILWDTQDSTNSYYDDTDGEDLVFVTSIGERQGEYGTEHYVIKIPSRLKLYKSGEETVTFYYEIA